MAAKPQGIKIVATNRKAHFKYALSDTYEAGLELVGSEVKSLRQGNCSLEDSYARPVGQELFLFNMHIAPYAQATIEKHEPKRQRKLLLNRREIDRITVQCTQRGFTLVPLKVYFKAGWAKVQIALARTRRIGDKREKELEKQRREDVRGALGRAPRERRRE